MDKSSSTNGGTATLNRSIGNGTPAAAVAASPSVYLPVRRASRHDRSSLASSNHESIYEGSIKEHIWAKEITDKNPAEFNLKDEDGDTDYLYHSLYLRHIVLDNKADDTDHVVWIDTDGHDEPISTPIAHMRRGLKEMCEIDLNFHTQVKFRLMNGKGPVHLVGQHVVEFPKERNLNDTELDTAEEDEHESAEEESEANKSRESGEDTKKSKSLKRKAPEPKLKRGRMDSKVELEEEDDDSDEDDEDYAEDVEMEESSDDDNEEEDDSDEDEDEEEDEDSDESESEESPQRIVVLKKKGKKQKQVKQEMNTSASKKKTTPKQKHAKVSIKKGKKGKK